MKNIRVFLSENFHFLVVKFSVYLNRRVFEIIRLLSTLIVFVIAPQAFYEGPWTGPMIFSMDCSTLFMTK